MSVGEVTVVGAGIVGVCSAAWLQRAGFKVIPAATAYTTQHKIGILAFIPSAGALQQSQLFLHEVIGMLWYRLSLSD